MFALVILILMVTQASIHGQTITPLYVQKNSTVTLTCPADDQVTTLTWTGPGGNLYVTGTRVEADLSDLVKPRISAIHTGGSYTLRFTEFRSSDTGIYTCTVDGTVNIQIVIVQGVTSASPLYTRQGGTVTLPCPNTNGTPVWSVTSTTVIYNQGTLLNPAIPDDTRTRLSVIIRDGNYNLQISDVQLSDVKEYRCSSGVTDTYYHLLLYIPPSFPEIENTVIVNGQNRTTGTEDRSMTLICNSRGGIPAASVSWIKDGTTLVTSDNTAQYTKVFTRADDRTVYTCQSSSPALTSPRTTSVLVYLYLKPGQPTISGQLSQTENNNLQVVCVSTGSRPAAMIQWNVGGTWQSNNPTEVKVKDSVTETYIVTSTLSLPVTRQDNGKSLYCRASNQALSGGIDSAQRSITVLFGPDKTSVTGNRVMVADGTNTLTLTCITQEHNRHVHITWYNGTTQIPNTAVVTNTSGTYGGYISTQVLQLTPSRYQGGNVIRCVVQNEDVTIGQKTASVTLNLHSPPVVTTDTSVIKGQIWDNVTVEVEFYSRPEVITSSITWTRGENGLNPPDKSVTSINTRSIQTLFHGIDIKVEGYVAAIQIYHLVEQDFGNYTVTLENSIGTTTYTIWLKSASPPLPPTDLEPVNFDSSSITLQWTQNFNGGAEQVFMIGYKSDVSKDFVDLAPISDNHVKTQSYQITGLKPSSMHFIRMFAKNELGSSDFVFLNQSTAAVENPPTIGTLTWVIAGGSAISLIAIVVVSIVIYNIYKRRSKDSRHMKT